ncbi:MAG: putative rane protein YgaE, family [Marmoricola sp.]|nr:putative rane protein YgaE, family [Marmoricola sp.]
MRVVDLVQTFKTALAGGLAWWIATDVAHLEQPFLSPWAAVLVVHATVYKTVSRGGQQVAATFFGVFLAFALGTTLGSGPWSLGLLILVGFLLGQLRWVKEEAGTIATTGLVTLATGSIARGDLLASRWIDTAVGVGVGLAVNLLVWPPLRDRAAWARAEGIPAALADVLREMAQGLGSDLDPKETKRWVRGIRGVDTHIDEAWRLLWEAKESGRLNPRRSQPTGVRDLKKLLHALEQGVADSLSMARNIAASAEAGNVWDESFRERWRSVALRTADLVEAEDLDGLKGLCDELESMTHDFSDIELGPDTWREYAGLLMNLRNVHDALTHAVDWMTESPPDRRRAKRYDTPRQIVRRRRASDRPPGPSS